MIVCAARRGSRGMHNLPRNGGTRVSEPESPTRLQVSVLTISVESFAEILSRCRRHSDVEPYPGRVGALSMT